MGVLGANQYRHVWFLKPSFGYSTPARNGTCCRSSYPNYKTVHRRFQTWCRNEVLRRVLTDIANELRERGALDEEECFIDATFAMAKGGGAEIGADEARKRHENHGDSGSPWIAALGQHARREPSRGPFGPALLRLLHDRSQAREFDR